MTTRHLIALTTTVAVPLAVFQRLLREGVGSSEFWGNFIAPFYDLAWLVGADDGWPSLEAGSSAASFFGALTGMIASIAIHVGLFLLAFYLAIWLWEWADRDKPK